jgi:hypothetical protein
MTIAQFAELERTAPFHTLSSLLYTDTTHTHHWTVVVMVIRCIRVGTVAIMSLERYQKKSPFGNIYSTSDKPRKV